MRLRYLVMLVIVASVTAFIGYSLFDQRPVNLLVYGLEGKRTDTMMVVMLQPKEKSVHVINLPRDTYYPTEGHDGLGQSKLNATFGFKNGGGTAGLKGAVQEITGLAIDYFVEVDYEGIEGIVNALGGVAVDVPFDMVYDDFQANPPLHIDFKSGPQVIDGKSAIGYLRFRKSNDGKVREGDIQRIERQQEFLKAAAAKSLSWRLPLVTGRALGMVNTDLNVLQGLKVATGMLGTKKEHVFFHVIPAAKSGRGRDGLSYYFHNPQGTLDLIQKIQDGAFRPK